MQRLQPSPSAIAHAETHMEKLRTWLRRRSASLVLLPGVEDCALFGNGPTTVRINSSASREQRLLAALHECGHVAIFESRKHAPRSRVAGLSQQEDERAIGRGRVRTTRKRLATLEEEMEAWTRGWRLARRLRVRVRTEAFEATRARSLMTYARWVARAASRPPGTPR